LTHCGNTQRPALVLSALQGQITVGYAANDEVDRMHTAWLKLRNFLASKHNTSFLKWCPAEAKSHPPNFSQFIEHCRRVKRQKATKKMIDTYCDKPSFLGGPEK
jgi:hypothetical protein